VPAPAAALVAVVVEVVGEVQTDSTGHNRLATDHDLDLLDHHLQHPTDCSYNHPTMPAAEGVVEAAAEQALHKPAQVPSVVAVAAAGHLVASSLRYS